MGYLKLPEAQMIAQSCRHDPSPYTATMQALQLQYGQPHQLAQSESCNPDRNWCEGWRLTRIPELFLASMLMSLEGPTGYELNCSSHVDRLLSKLPKYLRDGFIEFLQLQGKLTTASLNPYNLKDLAGWLQSKAQQQRLSNRLAQRYRQEQPHSSRLPKAKRQTAVYYGADPADSSYAKGTQLTQQAKPSTTRNQSNVYCLFCRSRDHYLTKCSNIKAQLRRKYGSG